VVPNSVDITEAKVLPDARNMLFLGPMYYLPNKVGAEGLDLKDDKEILLRDSPIDFAEAWIKNFKDKPLSVRFGQNTRGVVRKMFECEDVIKGIRSLLSNAFQHTSPVISMPQIELTTGTSFLSDA
jgi:hypothetical protein